MTIAVQGTRTLTDTAAGVTTFPYTFEIRQSDWIDVWLTDESTGVSTLQDPGLYTVTGIGQVAGGTVVFAAEPADVGYITVALSVPQDQLQDWPDDERKLIEDAADKLTKLVQEAIAGTGRALTWPVTIPEGWSTELPTFPVEEDQVLGADATAQSMVWFLKDDFKGDKGDPGPAGDGRFRVTTDDTTSDFAQAKIRAGNKSGYVTNPAGDERLALGVPFNEHLETANANVTMTVEQDGKIMKVTASTQAVTVTLPGSNTLPTTPQNGATYTVQKVDNQIQFPVEITPDGGNINGHPSIYLSAQHESVTLAWDGGNYRVVAYSHAKPVTIQLRASGWTPRSDASGAGWPTPWGNGAFQFPAMEFDYASDKYAWFDFVMPLDMNTGVPVVAEIIAGRPDGGSGNTSRWRLDTTSNTFPHGAAVTFPGTPVSVDCVFDGNWRLQRAQFPKLTIPSMSPGRHVYFTVYTHVAHANWDIANAKPVFIELDLTYYTMPRTVALT